MIGSLIARLSKAAKNRHFDYNPLALAPVYLLWGVSS